MLLEQLSWTSLESILLGAPADTMARMANDVFTQFGKILASATRADGTNVCLSATTIIEQPTFSYPTDAYFQSMVSSGILSADPQDEGDAWWDNSPLILWILALVFAAQTVRECVTKKRCVWCDVAFFFVVGLVGAIIWFLSFFSIHSLLFPNYNILWLTPLHLLFSIFYIVPKWREYTKWYLGFAAGMAMLFVPISMIMGQFVLQLRGRC